MKLYGHTGPMNPYSDNQSGENVAVPSGEAEFSGEDVSFFDRERWHDVETRDEDDSPEVSLPNATLSSISVAILLLVSVVAAGSGLGFVYYIHQATRWAALPNPDVSNDYRDIPQAWIGYTTDMAVRFREVEIPGCFAASSQGDVFVGEKDKPTLYCYSLQGILLATLTLDDIPTAVVFGEVDTLFPGQLVVAFRNRLAVYSTDGKQQTDWPPFRENGQVYSLALSTNAIFAADSAGLVVLRFDESGKLVREIGRKPKETPKDDDENVFPGFVVFRSTISLTVSKATGMLFVANPGRHRVEVFDPDGHWEPSQSWGEASAELFGFSGCCNPTWIDSLADGRIVTAEESSNLRVKTFFANGKPDWVVAGPDTLTYPPSNIPSPENVRTVLASSERPIRVAAISGDRIIVYDPVLRIFRLFLPTYKN